jgi:hypothetical protein
MVGKCTVQITGVGKKTSGIKDIVPSKPVTAGFWKVYLKRLQRQMSKSGSTTIVNYLTRFSVRYARNFRLSYIFAFFYTIFIVLFGALIVASAGPWMWVGGIMLPSEHLKNFERDCCNHLKTRPFHFRTQLDHSKSGSIWRFAVQ